MMIKFNTGKIRETVSNVLSDNKDAIAGMATTAAFLIFCKIVKIPVNVNPRMNAFRTDIPETPFSMGMMFCRNSTETAIASIMEGAEKSFYDNSRKEAANRIARIISGDDEVSKDTVSFAINALSKIARDMDYDSSRNYIYSLIEGLATKGEE